MSTQIQQEPMPMTVGEIAFMMDLPEWRVRRRADVLFGKEAIHRAAGNRLFSPTQVHELVLEFTKRGDV